MQKTLGVVATNVVKGNAWKKLTNPTVRRGKTAFPKTSADQQRLGVRLDYGGEVTIEGTEYHKYQMQPNAGNIPSTIKNWREANGGTHAVMADVYVKKGGTKEDVEEALKAANKTVQGV